MTIRGVAHRGYPAKFPENTLSSFRAACELAFTHLELDVQLTKDGVPVVFHDTSVERMTDGTGRIKDLTLKEIKELSVKGIERIPTLEEALDLLKDRLIVDIELKQAGDLYPGLEKTVLDTLKKKDMIEQSFLASFDHYSLAKARELNDKIGLGIINHGSSPALFPLAKELNCEYMSIRYEFITDEIIAKCEAENIIMIPYTIDDEKDMQLVVKNPSLLICTNELERWIKVYKQQ
ncbi:glycerophosphodiester phosphodiesterase [Paenibacillus sp. IITD108]|uniref:glycerophosphodiester phosphodiesterase n=1 Tax=Paenibacillus sp. IITD108 TaxID=3116649 RepID=UPI002F3F6367